MVPTKTPNGQIHICDNYRVTIDSQLNDSQHPISLNNELSTQPNKGEKFTKHEFSDAYLYVELDDDSKKFIVQVQQKVI